MKMEDSYSISVFPGKTPLFSKTVITNSLIIKWQYNMRNYKHVRMLTWVQFYVSHCRTVTAHWFHSNVYWQRGGLRSSANHDVSVTSLVIGCKHSRCENSLAMHSAEYGMNLWLLSDRFSSTVSSRASRGRPKDNHALRQQYSLITSYC
jgi:hypothetical protein